MTFDTDIDDTDDDDGPVPAGYGTDDDDYSGDTDSEVTDPFADSEFPPTVADVQVVEMPEWVTESTAPFMFDPREEDLTPEQRKVLAERRAAMMRTLFEPDGYTRDYDAEVDEIRTEERMFGITFSEFLFRYYPRNNIRVNFQDSTAVHISDKGITLTVGTFQREVVKKQAEQAADDALMVMSGNEAIRQSTRDGDLLELDETAESIKSGELDVHDIENAVVSQGAYQLARRGHNIGVIAVYKGGKSALMDHLAACSLSGGNLFGELSVEEVPEFVDKTVDEHGETHENVVPGRLLFIDPERGLGDAKMEIGRAFAWLKDQSGEILGRSDSKAVRERLVFYDAAEHPLNLAAPDDQRHLTEFCNENRITRVILDSAMMLSGKTDNLVDTEVDALFRSWEKIKSKTQIGETYWVVHTSHGDKSRAFGSQRWMARLQSIWLLQRDDEGSKFEFSVSLGRGGTRYPKREWGLDKDTMTPYFITALSAAEHADASRDESSSKTKTTVERSDDEHIAIQNDLIYKILSTVLDEMGDKTLDDGLVVRGGLNQKELIDTVSMRWDEFTNRFIGPAPGASTLRRRIMTVLDRKTETSDTPVYQKIRSGRSYFIYFTVDGYEEFVSSKES